MSTHTPGPWLAGSVEAHGTTVIAQQSGVGVAWCGCNTVASVNGESWSIDTREALGNAALIAAAPDLVATLTALREYVHRMATSAHETHEMARELLTRADATLAQAGLE